MLAWKLHNQLDSTVTQSSALTWGGGGGIHSIDLELFRLTFPVLGQGVDHLETVQRQLGDPRHFVGVRFGPGLVVAVQVKQVGPVLGVARPAQLVAGLVLGVGRRRLRSRTLEPAS